MFVSDVNTPEMCADTTVTELRLTADYIYLGQKLLSFCLFFLQMHAPKVYQLLSSDAAKTNKSSRRYQLTIWTRLHIKYHQEMPTCNGVFSFRGFHVEFQFHYFPITKSRIRHNQCCFRIPYFRDMYWVFFFVCLFFGFFFLFQVLFILQSSYLSVSTL